MRLIGRRPVLETYVYVELIWRSVWCLHLVKKIHLELLGLVELSGELPDWCNVVCYLYEVHPHL